VPARSGQGGEGAPRLVTKSAQNSATGPATVTGMDEARAVLDRLDRIEQLERGRAPAEVLLAELRALVTEAEAWSRREGAGDEAVESLRAALERAPSVAVAGLTPLA
jgi:hypothetical protein